MRSPWGLRAPVVDLAKLGTALQNGRDSTVLDRTQKLLLWGWREPSLDPSYGPQREQSLAVSREYWSNGALKAIKHKGNYEGCRAMLMVYADHHRGRSGRANLEGLSMCWSFNRDDATFDALNNARLPSESERTVLETSLTNALERQNSSVARAVAAGSNDLFELFR